MSPRASPCDGFTGDLPAYVDRELSDAQHGSLESHLDGCARCQARLKELEAVSTVLKGWDERSVAAHHAPRRLQHAVLARIAADGVRRRHDLRRARGASWALAASVLLAVGLPVGLRALRSAPPPTRPAVLEVAQVVPAPVSERLPEAAVQVARLAPHLLTPREWPAATPPAPVAALFSEEERESFLRAALPAQRALELERRFERLTGVRGVWVSDLSTGRRLLLTPVAAEFFAAEGPFDDLRLSTQEPYTSAPPVAEPRAPGTIGAHVRPLLRGDEGGTGWKERRRLLIFGGAPGTPRHLLDVFGLVNGEDAPRAAPDSLDPLAAQVAGVLRFEASGRDDDHVVALVEGSRLPVLLVAGHLLTGGATDRVLSRSVWLPASATRLAVSVPCVSVRAGARRGESPLRLTPFVAPPSLRALLSAGAAPSDVLAHARALRAAGMGGRAPLDWSLLDLFEQGRWLDTLANPTLAGALAAAHDGIVVADADGRFLGLEHVHVGGDAARLLVRRLVVGYQLEALQRRLGKMPTLPELDARLDETLAALSVSLSAFPVPPVAPNAVVPGVVRSAADERSAHVALESLEVDGHTVFLSAQRRP